MKLNRMNQLKAGEVLFSEGENSDTLYMVLKGKVELTGKGVRLTAGPGSLLGGEGLAENIHVLSATAIEDASVFAMDAFDEETLIRCLSSNEDYSGYIIYNHLHTLTDLKKLYQGLCSLADQAKKQLSESYLAYIELARSTGSKASLSPGITSLEDYIPCFDVNGGMINTYLELSAVSIDSLKAFYGPAHRLAIRNEREMAMIIGALADACSEVADYLCDLADLIGDSEKGLLVSACGLGLDIKKKGLAAAKADEIINRLDAELKRISDTVNKYTAHQWVIDAEQLAKVKGSYASGVDFREVVEENVVSGEIATRILELQDSFAKILAYSKYTPELADEYSDAMERFIALSDKESNDDEVRKLRKDLAHHFYEVYALCMVRAHDFGSEPLAVKLMLDFGFVSEKLLSEAQLAELLSIQPSGDSSLCQVYSLREWLGLIYEGEKEPSRNEMGLDYTEILREMRKQGQIDDKEEKARQNDNNAKLMHEVRNVFAYTQRLVSGQMSTFVPFLYSGQVTGGIVKAEVTAKKLNAVFSEVLQLDYSAFYRDVLFTDPKNGVEREYVHAEVLPDIIILPSMGQNLISWQEISGRRRDTAGRFIAPAFTYGNLNDMAIKAFGQFRWDLCKTIQGGNWNNMQYRSLTAEYSDYIQFFRKNKDLSEERREKLKVQIQRCRNNLRNIFTSDYEIWMKNEVNGAMKLNKVAREVMATYCPFPKETREKLSRQPVYADAFSRCERDKQKEKHDLDLRYKSLTAKGYTLSEELQKNLEFVNR